MDWARRAEHTGQDNVAMSERTPMAGQIFHHSTGKRMPVLFWKGTKETV
jgi:hypothetical protein